MTLEGFDFSFQRFPAIEALQAGAGFGVSYVSTPGHVKNWTMDEIAEYHAAGLSVVVVFQRGAQNALEGHARGVADATSADAQTNALNLIDCPIYFAVDFDASAAQLPVVMQYFDGATSVLGLDRVGIYGSFSVVGRALDGDHATYAWQTASWSQHQLDPRVHLYQYEINTMVGGYSVDRDRTIVSDTNFGQVSHLSTAPSVAAIEPVSGDEAGGTEVVITGQGFTTATDVGFGFTSAAAMTVDSDDQISAISPPGVGTVHISVRNEAGWSDTTSADEYTYSESLVAPSVAAIEPVSGDEAGGTEVVITGQGFTTATDVGFGFTSAAAMTVDSDDQISAISPPGVGTVHISVRNEAGWSDTTSADEYTYSESLVAPSVAAIEPVSGDEAGGTEVVITGQGFTTATDVGFGFTSAAAMTVDSDDQISAISPPGVGTVHISVRNEAGWSDTTSADEYTFTN